MRFIAHLAPFAAVAALAGAAAAQPASVVVTVSPDMDKTVKALGQRDVQEQIDDLTSRVQRTLASRNALDGATIALVITDLKPNRPTIQQINDKPGLDMMRSISIGGAAIEGTVTTASGEVHPVRSSYFSTTLADVQGFTTWQDARTAFDRLARNLAEGRYVTR